MRAPSTLAALAAAAGVVTAQQTAYGQCGGTGWTGYKTCVSGLKCLLIKTGYSQCVPSSLPGPTATSAGSTPTATGTAPGAAETLKGDNLWIRAVAAPNFHKYLQSSPPRTAGVAILGDAGTAGQFAFADGRLILVTETEELEAIVGTEVIGPGAGRLAVTFSTGRNAYGGFKYSGDALQWHVGGVTRPNESAWLVCGGQELFVNLGSYGYQTPEGCVDQTIHFYSGATADV